MSLELLVCKSYKLFFESKVYEGWYIIIYGIKFCNK